jgi:hypothetical protein
MFDQPVRFDPMPMKQRLQAQNGQGDDDGHGRGAHRQIHQQRPSADPSHFAANEK